MTRGCRPLGGHVAFFGAVVVVLSLAHTANAYFERMMISARSTAMGGAFVSVADDATSVMLNPAGLAGVNRYGFYSTYHKPYGLAELDDGFVAGAWRTPRLSVGLGLYHRALLDVYSETLVSLSIARDVVRTAEDASLSVGMNLDAATVSETGSFDISERAFMVGAGVSVRPFATVGLAYAVRNIGQADLGRVAGGVGALRRTHVMGVSYRWDDGVLLSLERRVTAGKWENAGGLELEMGNNLTVRAGVHGRYAAGGFGVRVGGATVDIGAVSHDVLGASYVVSVAFSPRRPDPLSAGGGQ